MRMVREMMDAAGRRSDGSIFGRELWSRGEVEVRGNEREEVRGTDDAQA